MKTPAKLLATLIATVSISATTTLAQEPADIYLNQNIGFNVEGYKYTQKEFPCNVDKLLVEKIVEKGRENNLSILATHADDDIYDKGVPILAVDIISLVLGSDEHNYGKKTDSNLPSVKVTAALIEKSSFNNGYVMANHSCAIATLNEFTPSSNVLDLGSGGVTVCGAVEKCLRDLSNDVIRWSESQLGK